MTDWGMFIRDRLSDSGSYESVVGIGKAAEPEIVEFLNSRPAVQMLYRHIMNKSSVVIHADVDVDGVETCYIMHRFLEEAGLRGRLCECINKDKVHGVKDIHIEYFKNTGAGLVIIVDSATNDIDVIKQMHCDVLVIDHHDVKHTELTGKTAGGEYIIVNNTLSNPESGWAGDDRMSCGMTVYELLRFTQKAFGMHDILKAFRLYQCVGVTLITDAILTGLERNQWYIDKMIYDDEFEAGIGTMVRELNPKQERISKSFIDFSLAPAINRAIRAGYSSAALEVAVYQQARIGELLVFKQIQSEIVEDAMRNVVKMDGYCIRDTTQDNFSLNYNGLLATKILNTTQKDAAVYKVMESGHCKGSFRGKYSKLNYRKNFADTEGVVYADGHSNAFGYEATLEGLHRAMAKMYELEKGIDKRRYLTAGDMDESEKGIYHIADEREMQQFMQSGLFATMCVANSKLSKEEEIVLIIPNDSRVKLKSQYGKVRTYDAFGFECKAFEEMTTRYLEVYADFDQEIKVYIRNIWY